MKFCEESKNVRMFFRKVDFDVIFVDFNVKITSFWVILTILTDKKYILSLFFFLNLHYEQK